MVDLAIVEGIITLVFAVWYAVTQEYVLKFAGKYLFLIGVLITTFQLWLEFNTQNALLILFIFAISLMIFFLMIDLVSFIPVAVNYIRNRARR